MNDAPAAKLQAPASSENANPAPTASLDPVPVTVTTVADLAKAIAGNRLKAAAASPQQTQDAATPAAPVESHPAGTEDSGETDLSQAQPDEGQVETEAPAPSDDESAEAVAETPEQKLARLEKALAKKDKRIAKLTARLHEQEDEAGSNADGPTPEVKPTQATEPAPTGPVPVTAELELLKEEEADLVWRMKGLERVSNWLDGEGMNGGLFKDQAFKSELQVTAENVQDLQAEAAKLREQHETRIQAIQTERAVVAREARRQWQAEQATLEQQFRAEFPALVRRDSPERAQFEHLLNNLPPQLRTAGAKLVVAKALAYDTQKGKAKAAPPKPAGNPAPVLTRPMAADRPTSEGQAVLREAKAAYERDGSVKNLARMRAAERALQR